MVEKPMSYTPGILIKSGKEREFFSELNKKHLGKEFWEECKYLRNNINERSLAELDKLMDKETDE